MPLVGTGLLQWFSLYVEFQPNGGRTRTAFCVLLLAAYTF